MSAPELSVLRAGALASVVDRGRFGFRCEGVAPCGALDALAYAVANRLAGNASNAAAVEITYGGVKVRFGNRARVALTGADCAADLDGARVDAWESFVAESGATLTMRSPRAGARSYLAIDGGIGVPSVLDSRTTDLGAGFGGYRGRALRSGDALPMSAAGAGRAARVRVKPPQWDFARDAFAQAAVPVRLLPGGEYARLDAAARERLWNASWRIAPQSSRMGYRLTGEPLTIACGEMRSHAVFAGIVQLPPSGEPIVLLADAQVTGGYPVLGAVIAADLWKLAQLPIGAALRFVPATLDEAAAAQREIDAYLAAVDGALARARGAA